jgi:hypothetical protein
MKWRVESGKEELPYKFAASRAFIALYPISFKLIFTHCILFILIIKVYFFLQLLLVVTIFYHHLLILRIELRIFDDAYYGTLVDILHSPVNKKKTEAKFSYN